MSGEIQARHWIADAGPPPLAREEPRRADPALPHPSISPYERATPHANAMTIDVEDWFQVEALASTIDRGSWERLPPRVEANTGRLLDILGENGVAATFFVLGWVALRHPALVRRIVAGGHELASHGTGHLRVDRQTPAAFREDVRDGKRILEDIGGVPVLGYRAPTFSLGPRTLWAYPVLAEEGYRYSSSLYPGRHGAAGTGGGPRGAFTPVAGLIEIPMTTVSLLGLGIPASGGGYFRLFPYRLSHWLLARASRAGGGPAVFYLHPWEIDPDQPRQLEAPWPSRFRHYLNLARSEPRWRRLLRDFAWTRIDRLFLPGLADGCRQS